MPKGYILYAEKVYTLREKGIYPTPTAYVPFCLEELAYREKDAGEAQCLPRVFSRDLLGKLVLQTIGCLLDVELVRRRIVRSPLIEVGDIRLRHDLILQI